MLGAAGGQHCIRHQTSETLGSFLADLTLVAGLSGAARQPRRALTGPATSIDLAIHVFLDAEIVRGILAVLLGFAHIRRGRGTHKGATLRGAAILTVFCRVAQLIIVAFDEVAIGVDGWVEVPRANGLSPDLRYKQLTTTHGGRLREIAAQLVETDQIRHHGRRDLIPRLHIGHVLLFAGLDLHVKAGQLLCRLGHGSHEAVLHAQLGQLLRTATALHTPTLPRVAAVAKLQHDGLAARGALGFVVHRQTSICRRGASEQLAVRVEVLGPVLLIAGLETGI
mmetsp:Transcript_44189/g.96093  ORF Transcript_44189/g.96093 Transcript_44189/m.96093 type:complete len:281 (-) Transcript_44189:2943-3785(-)